ncbi:hypothetical protein H2248_001953 [Termitomyces sp. 'cryptogamus']|nr:hypothetical protein H2248_001953 [Termitomyces sp. 'cryptogamus']
MGDEGNHVPDMTSPLYRPERSFNVSSSTLKTDPTPQRPQGLQGLITVCTLCLLTMPTMPVYLPLLDDPRHQLVELEAEILRVATLLSKLVQRRILLKRDINRRFSLMLYLPI